MVPYSTFTFFMILFILLMPAMILGLRGKSNRLYGYILSLIFIGFIYGDNVPELLSIIGYTIYQWLLIKFNRSYGKQEWAYRLLILLSILPLVTVKMNPLLTIRTVFGFLGISYLTFKCVQILIEMKDGLIKEIKLNDFIRFLLFFPTITSGPIDRFRRFIQDEGNIPPAKEYGELLYLGIHRIFQGFLYKFILAFLIDKYWLSLDFVHDKQVVGNMRLAYHALPHLFTYSTFLGIVSHLSYMYAYSLYLFFDFAGYSAFAIGTSYILGIRTPENFNKPFLSRNIKDFWNRWHMTLSYWFRDYVFMRMVMLLTRKKIIKNKSLISAIGYLSLFGLMGFWHGFVLHYIVYGFYHAALMIGYDRFEKVNKRYKFWRSTTIANMAGIFITFQFVCFGFYIFSGKLF